jgi:hypothetical protein
LINDFEIAPAGSYEWDLLGRLWVTGRYESMDVFRLARLTVLESIAMYQNMRADLSGTMTGARLEGEMSALWDAAEFFYVGAGAGPMNFASLTQSRVLVADLGAAYRQVSVSLGSLPGLSPRAADHLQDVSRLLPTMESVLDAIETDVLGTGAPAPPANPPPDPAALREASRRLIPELQGLIQSVSESNPPPPGRDGLMAGLNGLLDLFQGFDRMLTAEPSAGDLVRSLRKVSNHMGSVEVQIVRLAGTPELARRWREFRQRIYALSDDLGLPRVISLVPAAPLAQGVDRKRLAPVDRAVAALDKFLSEAVPGQDEATDAGSRFRGDVAQLRRALLQFRQQVAANEPAERLSRSLREIEIMNRRLSDRARSESLISRGVTRLDARGFREPAQALEELHDLMQRP